MVRKVKSKRPVTGTAADSGQSAREPRDYRAEYARRIERGLGRGLSRSQARGHSTGARAGKEGSRRGGYDSRLEKGLKAIKRGARLSDTARELRIAPERLRQYLRASGVAEKRRGRWVVENDRRARYVQLYTNGELRSVRLAPPQDSEWGKFMHAVRVFEETNDRSVLEPFVGRGVTDIRGVFHPFETRPNVLLRLAYTGGESFEQIYRIVM